MVKINNKHKLVGGAMLRWRGIIGDNYLDYKQAKAGRFSS
jgi:hypothetical protein